MFDSFGVFSMYHLGGGITEEIGTNKRLLRSKMKKEPLLCWIGGQANRIDIRTKYIENTTKTTMENTHVRWVLLQGLVVSPEVS